MDFDIRPGPKRTPLERAQDTVEVESYHLRGKTFREIAELLNARGRRYTLTHQQIHHDVKQLVQAWISEAKGERTAFVARELRSLEHQARELWESWETSKQGVGQCGNPQFMRLLLDVSARRSKLLGLDAPTQNEISGPGGAPIKNDTVLPEMSMDEIIALATEIKRTDAEKLNNV